jgi:hypothetical protein
VIDCFSRRVVGWALADHLRSELVIEAVEMAVARRRPAPGLVHHSDQGAQPGLNRSSQQCVCEMNLETAGDCSAGVRGGTRWRGVAVVAEARPAGGPERRQPRARDPGPVVGAAGVTGFGRGESDLSQ